jgi:hypothetical protein
MPAAALRLIIITAEYGGEVILGVHNTPLSFIGY